MVSRGASVVAKVLSSLTKASTVFCAADCKRETIEVAEEVAPPGSDALVGSGSFRVGCGAAGLAVVVRGVAAALAAAAVATRAAPSAARRWAMNSSARLRFSCSRSCLSRSFSKRFRSFSKSFFLRRSCSSRAFSFRDSSARRLDSARAISRRSACASPGGILASRKSAAPNIKTNKHEYPRARFLSKRAFPGEESRSFSTYEESRRISKKFPISNASFPAFRPPPPLLLSLRDTLLTKWPKRNEKRSRLMIPHLITQLPRKEQYWGPDDHPECGILKLR